MTWRLSYSANGSRINLGSNLGIHGSKRGRNFIFIYHCALFSIPFQFSGNFQMIRTLALCMILLEMTINHRANVDSVVGEQVNTFKD